MLIDILKNLEFNEAILCLIAYAIAVVVALVAREYMHAYAAVKQGDLTPKAYGRLTVNPVAHFDVIGLICFILVGFGWAKPVPINSLNFYNHKKGTIIVSLAGILTNLVLAFLFMGFYVLTCAYLSNMGLFSLFLYYLFQFLFSINLSLAIFNLLPIYPLDGFNFLNAFFRYNNKFVDFMMKWGSLILIALVIVGVLGWLISKAVNFLSNCGLQFWQWILC